MNETLNTIRRDLNQWRSKIHHGGGADYMRGLYSDTVAWTEAAREGVQRVCKGIRSEFSRAAERWDSGLDPRDDPKPLYYPTLASHAANLGGWFSLLLEGLLAGSMSIWLFNLPATWAFVIGVSVCVATAIFIKGICSPILLARAEAHPRQASHWLVVTLLVLAPLELGLLTMAFLVRGATGEFALAIAWTFGVVAAVLSVTTPILAALLFTAASLFGWSKKLSAQYESALQLERDVVKLRASSKRELGRLSGLLASDDREIFSLDLTPRQVEGGQLITGTIALPYEASDTGAKITLSTDKPAIRIPDSIPVGSASREVTFAGLTDHVDDSVVATISAKYGSRVANATVTVAPPRRTGGHAATLGCLVGLLFGIPLLSHAQTLGQIWIDSTSSVAREDLLRALDHTRGELRAVSTQIGITKWEFYRISDDAWSAVPYYTFQPPPYTPAPCPMLELSEAEKAFRGVSEALKRKAKQTCASRLRQERQQYETQTTKLFDQAAAELVPVDPSRGRCTALADLFQRLGRASKTALSIVITDGVESCATLSFIPHTASGATYIILVRTDAFKGSLAEDFQRRASAIKANIPWAIVLPFWAFSATDLRTPSAHASAQ